MPVTVNFSTDQDAGDLEGAILTDTSTGSGSNITGRLVYLRKYDGSYLTPSGYTVDYIYWPYQSGTGDTITIDCLDKDYCLDISVVFYSGSSVYATKTILTLFTGYTEVFLRQLTQALAGNRIILGKNNFTYNKFRLRTYLEDAQDGVALINDQTIAQWYLDECKRLTDNIGTFY